MGKALRREHIDYFTSRMTEHDRVINWVIIVNQHEYLFKISRTLPGSASDVIVHLTDAYRYGLAEFFARPNELKVGSYIVLGMPHADVASEVIEEAKRHRIGIGHIGKFMGALNYEKIWEYLTRTNENRKRRSNCEEKRGPRVETCRRDSYTHRRLFLRKSSWCFVRCWRDRHKFAQCP